MGDERDREKDERGLRTYQIDENSVRINNPDPDEPDLMARKLASGEVKSYPQKKR